MTTIKDFLTAEISAAYNRGFTAGYDQARAELEACVNEIAANRSAPVAARRDATQPSTERKVRKLRRGLTPTEVRVVDFVAAHPGCTMADIRAANVVSSPAGTVYKLVARRKLARREDPKPHANDRPWVHFYLPGATNDQT